MWRAMSMLILHSVLDLRQVVGRGFSCLCTSHRLPRDLLVLRITREGHFAVSNTLKNAHGLLAFSCSAISLQIAYETTLLKGQIHQAESAVYSPVVTSDCASLDRGKGATFNHEITESRR